MIAALRDVRQQLGAARAQQRMLEVAKETVRRGDVRARSSRAGRAARRHYVSSPRVLSSERCSVVAPLLTRLRSALLPRHSAHASLV